MSTVLLLILLFISIIMTGLILIQQSEGGALGIGGGGGGGGGFMSGRSAANSVSRMTGILGAAFLICCLMLSIVFNKENQDISNIDATKAVEGLTIETDSVEDTDPLAGVDAPQSTETETPDATPGTSAPETAEETPETPKEPEHE